MLFNFSLKKIMLPILISSWCQFAIADEAPSVATHKSLDDKIDSLLIEQALPGLVLLIKHQG